jgi:uncharacterized protein YwgA
VDHEFEDILKLHNEFKPSLDYIVRLSLRKKVQNLLYIFEVSTWCYRTHILSKMVYIEKQINLSIISHSYFFVARTVKMYLLNKIPYITQFY